MDLHDPYSQHDLTDDTTTSRTSPALAPRVRAPVDRRHRFDDDEPRAARSRRPAPDLEGPDPAGPGERSEDVPYSTWLGALHGPTPRPTGW